MCDCGLDVSFISCVPCMYDLISAIVPLSGYGTSSPSPDIGYLFPLFLCSQTKPCDWLELHPNQTLQRSWQKAVNFRDPQLPYAVTDTDALGSFSPSLSHRHAHHYVHSNTHAAWHAGARTNLLHRAAQWFAVLTRTPFNRQR